MAGAAARPTLTGRDRDGSGTRRDGGGRRGKALQAPPEGAWEAWPLQCRCQCRAAEWVPRWWCVVVPVATGARPGRTRFESASASAWTTRSGCVWRTWPSGRHRQPAGCNTLGRPTSAVTRPLAETQLGSTVSFVAQEECATSLQSPANLSRGPTRLYVVSGEWRTKGPPTV